MMNEHLKPGDSHILYSKDLEAFILYIWKTKTGKNLFSIAVLNILFYIIPFLIDSYFITEYSMLEFGKKYKPEEAIVDEGSSIGIKGLSLFGLFVILMLELCKIIASQRNKYSSILSSKNYEKTDRRPPAINWSFFNFILFSLYFAWAFENTTISIDKGRFMKEALDLQEMDKSSPDFEPMAAINEALRRDINFRT